MKNRSKYITSLLAFGLIFIQSTTALAQDKKEDKSDITIAKAVLETYLGDYKMGNDTLHIVMVGEEIKAKGPGYPPLDLKAVKENRFYLRQFGVDVEFVKGDDGKIEKLLMIRADGQQLEAPKLE